MNLIVSCFRHGTGHGIGAYGNIHEGPISVRPTKQDIAPAPLRENMFFSDEPGYYEDGVYGIRLETIVRVVKKEAQSEDGTYGMVSANAVDSSIDSTYSMQLTA